MIMLRTVVVNKPLLWEAIWCDGNYSDVANMVHTIMHHIILNIWLCERFVTMALPKSLSLHTCSLCFIIKMRDW